MGEQELKRLIKEAEKWRLNLLELAHMMTFEEHRDHGLERARILEKLIEIAKEQNANLNKKRKGVDRNEGFHD